MSDIFLSSQQQLANALKQLQSTASVANAPLAQQASQVIVKHLSGNQLLLQNPKGELQLPARTLRGELVSGQSYNVQLSPTDSGKLSFSSTSVLVPASLADSAVQRVNTPLPKALADILLLRTLSDPAAPATNRLGEALKTENGTVVISAQVLSARGKTLTLQVANSQIAVRLPTSAEGFSTGQPVQLQYQKSGEWTLALAQKPGASAPPERVRITLPTQQASPIALAMPRQPALPLTSSGAEALLNRLPPPLQSLAPQLTQLRNIPDAAQLVIREGGKVDLQLNLAPGSERASIKLSAPQLQQLHSIVPGLTQTSKTLSGMPPELQVTMPTSGNTVQAGNAGSVLSSSEPVAKSLEALQSLLRRIHATSEPPSATLNKIDQALKDPVVNQSDSAKLIQQLGQQLNQSLPRGEQQDSLALRALLSQPAMALTPLSLTTPASQSGFVGGLITLLQLSLAARQSRSYPAQSDKLAERLSGMLENTGGARVSARGLADLAQVEQRHQLIRNLSLLLTSHTGHKAVSAESQLQGQDSFYYSLPLGNEQQRKDLELLIRREPPPDKKNQQQAGNQKQWHLTMKLDVGDLGGLLAKARLHEMQLELDFYAANDTLKDKVICMLPVLKKRLLELGIEVHHSQCQLGKIPTTLQQRPYQVFETQA
ncbi:flagellar hook-length control protein FliK [Lacimicrobium sp. SS2-24]|uniref:flagellar hook-length control protein FliK n=1 Tax=Lacimicrobium sp. SS2-24 TaxID=2005569 RepID=UPI000B4A7FCC|nr:flagellar hook-length control protein FliK [Lacimicrobium sp. SS2-24]